MRSLGKYSVVIVLGCLLLGCNKKVVVGNGHVVTENRMVGTFEHIDASGPLQLEITRDRKPSVTVIAEDNVQRYVVTRDTNHRLQIEVAHGVVLSLRAPILIKIALPALHSLSTAGNVKVHIPAFQGRRLDVHLSGESELLVSGSADKTAMMAVGNTRIDALQLQSKVVSLDVNGEAKVSVYATQTLNVKISGSGEVTYGGNPRRVNQAIFGLGQVKKLPE